MHEIKKIGMAGGGEQQIHCIPKSVIESYSNGSSAFGVQSPREYIEG